MREKGKKRPSAGGTAVRGDYDLEGAKLTELPVRNFSEESEEPCWDGGRAEEVREIMEDRKTCRMKPRLMMIDRCSRGEKNLAQDSRTGAEKENPADVFHEQIFQRQAVEPEPMG